MEDMYRIKFCKVPVQKKLLIPWKTVYSIQSIFQEILDVLEWLRDSGQTTKFTQTKEFLDGNIRIKFAENFAFKLQVGFKPVFDATSTDTKINEQNQANTDLNIGVLNLNSSAPEADDYNKYIIISDLATNKWIMAPAVVIGDIDTNIDTAAAAAEKSKENVLTDSAVNSAIISYSQSTIIFLVRDMLDFLQANQSFMQNLTDSLNDVNSMSSQLMKKVESAN